MASANNPLLFIISEPVGSPAVNEIAYRLADHGVRTWIGSLAPTGELKDQAVDALRGSAAVLLVFDAAAAQSHHVDRHLLVARQMGKPLIPLSIQPADEGLLREALRDAQWVDGSAPEAAIAEISRRAFDYDRSRGAGAGAAAGAAAGASPPPQPAPGSPRIQVVPVGPSAGPAVAAPPRRSPDPEQALPPAAAARPGRSRFASPTMLLGLLALLAVGAAILYTAFASGGGGGEDERTVAQQSAPADYSTPEDGEDSFAGSQSAPTADQPASPAALPPRNPSLEAPTTAAAGTTLPPAAPQEVAAAEAPQPSAAPPAASAAPAAGGAAATVQAFYSALSRGDGASAARYVVPNKRQSGPLSGQSLTRYYSSFRRPLRISSMTPVDANTVRVSYDYVLGDGRLCRGNATVNVAGGLVSGINTRGPC